MALSFTTITNTIAALSVAGVTFKDIDEVPTEGDRVAIIVPLDNFITNFSLDDMTLGMPSVRQMTVTYTLNYRLLLVRVGAGRSNTIEAYNDLTIKVGLFLDAILAMDDITGVVDLVPSPSAVTSFGQVLDPSGLAYFGCDFHLDCTEHVN